MQRRSFFGLLQELLLPQSPEEADIRRGIGNKSESCRGNMITFEKGSSQAPVLFLQTPEAFFGHLVVIVIAFSAILPTPFVEDRRLCRRERITGMVERIRMKIIRGGTRVGMDRHRRRQILGWLPPHVLLPHHLILLLLLLQEQLRRRLLQEQLRRRLLQEQLLRLNRCVSSSSIGCLSGTRNAVQCGSS